MKALIARVLTRVFNLQNIGIWLLSATVAAYMGPFGTFLILEPLERTIIWFAILAWGLGAIAICMSVEDELLPDLSFAQREYGRLALMPPVIIAPMYPVVAAYLAPQAMPIGPVQALIACYLLGALVTVARFSIYFSHRGADAKAGAGPRLLQRLPGEEVGPILRITGKDHFVEIVTATGRYNIRMRLADAIKEMDGVEGLLTHRSHWVAREAILDVAREGGRHFIVAKDEERIPVSRSNVAKLEEAGFF
ncbi:MAG: LytTR family DNA-binding domain-containing protein [Pseudomonadota bacterium]